MNRREAKNFWPRTLRAAIPLILLACGNGPEASDLFGQGSRSGTPFAGASTGGGAPIDRAGSSPVGVGGGSNGGAGASDAGWAGSAGTSTAGKPSIPAGGAGSGGAATAGAAGKSGPEPGQGGMIGTAGEQSAGASGGETPTGGTDAGSAGQGGDNSCESSARELCDGVDNDCDGSVDEGAECPRGCTGRAIEGRGYMFCIETEAEFEPAGKACARMNMHLAWIESKEENEAIASLVRDSGENIERFWAGGADIGDEGNWRWLDPDGLTHGSFWSGGLPNEGGKSVDGAFVNWGEERPNGGDGSDDEDCLSISLNRSGLEAGSWNDDICNDPWPFVCER